MSNQQLKDDIEKIVLALGDVIPALESLADDARDNIDKKLEGSLVDIDHKISELSNAIYQLQNAVDCSNIFITTAKDDAIDHLQKGITELIETDIKAEYKDQIERIAEAIKPVIVEKLDCEIAKMIDQKTLSIKDYNTQITNINRDFKTNMATTHDLISENVTKLNQANTDASTRFDDNLDKLHQITQDHQEALTSVQNNSALIAQDMQKTLNNIERLLGLVSNSTTTIIIWIVGFLAACVMIAIVNKLELWKSVFLSAIGLGIFLGLIAGLIFWFNNREE